MESAILYKYDAQFLSEEEGSSLKGLFDRLNDKFITYKIRGKELKARPKIEFSKSSGLVYRWGQQRDFYDVGFFEFPAEIEALVSKLGDPSVNHVIVTKYTDGLGNHIPFHQDKQEGVPGAGAKDIKANTNIYNVVVCDNPRVFQLARCEDVVDGEATEFVFNEPLIDGSLMTLTAQGNLELKHRVPKEKHWKGTRYSIVLRTLKSASMKRKREAE